MARLARLTVPGHLHHLLQRGNNGQTVFLDSQDRERMLALLGEQSAALGVALHGYVLLDDQFQLLATPQDGDALTALMQGIGRRYSRYFNDRHRRTGTLWDGRFRSTVLQAEHYLLPAMVSLDLAPVRAGLVSDPREHRASSHAHYIGLHADRRLTPHPLYWALGNTPFAREAAYAELVRAGLPPAAQQALDASVQNGWALGDNAFLDALQAQTPRRVRKALAGRPARPY